MSRFDWLSELLARMQGEHILIRHDSRDQLAPAHLLELDAEDWGRAAVQAAGVGCLWQGVWAEELGDEILITCALERAGDHLLLRTAVPREAPLLPSHTPHFPAADRLERHAQDLLGVVFTDHPDPRRWTRHGDWGNRFPLRRTEPRTGPAARDTQDHYPFLQAQGAGVHEIPVGPVHAGIIEPGHFRFQAVGETVLNLEPRLSYAHKGIEKIAVGRTPEALARLAGRVSGDTTVGHAWAACMAMERAAGIEVPPRALALRGVMAERERVANHLGDIGAICNDVGFAFAWHQFSRLRELWQRQSAEAFGHRLMMDRIVPGGVAAEPTLAAIEAMRDGIRALRRDLDELLPLLDDYPSLEERLRTTGILSPELAARLGCSGYVGRASGQDRDLRRDNPYPPYDRFTLRVPTYAEGDVMARLKVRGEETLIALELIDSLLLELPPGPLRSEWRLPPANAEGLGSVEGWRGPLLSFVRFDGAGRVQRYFPLDPSWFHWPALEQLIQGNIVPDFPVCNKSVNGSYSGCDL